MIDDLRLLAEEAGREILGIFRSGAWQLTEKSDQSPVTQADTVAHKILVEGIARLSPHPIISEEATTPLAAHGTDTQFWLIDPLDGTRDFIAGFETFVSCIALIDSGRPSLALIHQPVTGATWWAARGQGAFGPAGVRLANTRRQGPPYLAVRSRSAASERMQEFNRQLQISEAEGIGSALKFCLLAEGVYDLYPRFGPTSEWDTAAGQLIAEESGCKVIEVASQTPLTYGKPGYLNRGFIASRADLDIVGELHRRGLIPRPPVKPS